MLDKVLYKSIILAPYILLVVSIALFILGAVKKGNNKPCKKMFVASAVTLVLGIIVFFIPFIVIWQHIF